jgi:CHAT domain-containing protein
VLVAFGDPVYPAAPVASPGERRPPAAPALAALPFSRAEVEAIARHFGPEARVFLGREATEERAKSSVPRARYVHFASHGTLDERFPLLSGLALSPDPEGAGSRDNGLLQAWEILDQMRLTADLVTLSACNTGLGKEMGGEGLLGLTRAFLYAGARSVLASSWAVSDRSTARLMDRFYGHLKAGQSRDVALQSAQRDLLRAGRGRTFSTASPGHPFHWAAFQLAGDWR